MKSVKEVLHDCLIGYKCDGLADQYSECQCALSDLVSCNMDRNILHCLAAREVIGVMFAVKPKRSVQDMLKQWIDDNGYLGLERPETECWCLLDDDSWLACNGDCNIKDCTVASVSLAETIEKLRAVA